jgi:hypothetical protein
MALQNSMKPQITAALFFSLEKQSHHAAAASTCFPHPVLPALHCKRESPIILVLYPVGKQARPVLMGPVFLVSMAS